MTLEKAHEIVQAALIRALKCNEVLHSKRLDEAMQVIDRSRAN